jgi:ribosomal protein L14E/L6E/L27E
MVRRRPREAYPALERSRTLKRIDEKPVWSVVCFFVANPFRRKRVNIEAFKGCHRICSQKRRKNIVEGYPIEPKKDRMSDAFAYTGLASTFRKAGFVEVARRTENRPIMRYMIEDE